MCKPGLPKGRRRQRGTGQTSKSPAGVCSQEDRRPQPRSPTSCFPSRVTRRRGAVRKNDSRRQFHKWRLESKKAGIWNHRRPRALVWWARTCGIQWLRPEAPKVGANPRSGKGILQYGPKNALSNKHVLSTSALKRKAVSVLPSPTFTLNGTCRIAVAAEKALAVFTVNRH